MSAKQGSGTAKAGTAKEGATVTPIKDVSPRQQSIRFRSENLKSSYCNMCNATSTREEVVLNFGLNQSWDQPTTKPGEVEVDLQHRIVISPFAAKRLSRALAKLVEDYESRYGALD